MSIQMIGIDHTRAGIDVRTVFSFTKKKMAEALLKDGKTYASGIFSEKTGKTYDAYIVLEDDGQRSAYKLEFSKESRK